MELVIYKKTDDRPERLGEMTLKGTIDKAKDFMTIVSLNLTAFLSNYLGERVTDNGFWKIWSCGDYWSSFYVREGVPKDIRTHGMREFAISGRANPTGEGSHYEWTEKPVATESGETDLIVGVEVYDTGFIVGSSASVTNIMGGAHKAYFSKITAKNFKQSSRAYAKVFKDEKALLKYMREKKDVFAYITEKNGLTFGYEPVSEKYVEGRKAPLTGETFDALDTVFSEINGTESAEPEFRIGKTPFEEALIRMEELDLYAPVRAGFQRNQTIFMSEFGGAVYDLNEQAEDAIAETRKFGLPYHVIRTQTNAGDMYSVLYVSNYPEEWKSEHRDPRDGCILANVYNASMGIAEIGDIWVDPANGGLRRTA